MRKAEIHRITSKDLDVDASNLGLDGSPTRVVKIFTPSPPPAGETFEGSPDELAEKIFQKLLECKVTAAASASRPAPSQPSRWRTATPSSSTNVACAVNA
jgi:hypothetical protein